LNTVDKEEIEKFSRLAKDWWNPNGKFKPLHIWNPARINFIKKKLIKHFDIDSKSSLPLKNINILDIGCGGGLLCEPLKRLGANITGLDASKNNIEVAKLHSKEMSLDIDYINSSPENFKSKNKFDVILNMEIVEHVANVDLFIHNCSELIKKNGIMFISTINRNLKSYFFAIIGAEYILRWLPIGTHDWSKFITPNEIELIANKKNFITDEIIGMKFNPLTKKWYVSSDLTVNYIGTFLKN
jgi:2-polyprenyl-6-hydroxyphenyl methylase/3-demethylubiquinone-9 3-methyltransferase